jgi:hypothetical protein
MAAFLTLLPYIASAQITITLPDVSLTTTLTATVSEQCSITLPSSIVFNVTDVSSATHANGAISVANIVTSTALKQLRLSVQANAANFTPPVAMATTWSAGDVTWAAGSWTNATGSSGTLSNSSYSTVTTGTANVTSLSIAALTFTLAAKTTVQRSGNHTLTVTWKVESI